MHTPLTRRSGGDQSKRQTLYFPGELFGLVPLALALTLVPWALVAITLLDAVRRPAIHWEQSRQDQLLWTIVILSGGLIPLIGPVAYLLVARPRLNAVAHTFGVGGPTSTFGADQDLR